MPHPLATELQQFTDRLIGVSKRSQLADIAKEIQDLAIRLNVELVTDSDCAERIDALRAQLSDLERRFNYDRDDKGQVLMVGTARRTAPDKLELIVPAYAGLTAVPFDVTAVTAETQGDALVIALSIRTH